MKTPLSPRGWTAVGIALFWALALATASALSGCDLAPVEQLTDAAEPTYAPAACSDELRDIVEARHEQLACLAECDEIMLACLDQEAPECHYCEHDRAVCAASCPGGAIVQ